MSVILEDHENPFYSAYQCDCGCEQFLPQHLFDLGWRFLRRHKPVGSKITKKKTLNLGRAPRMEPGTTTNWASIERFVLAEIEVKQARLREVTERLAEMDALKAEQTRLVRECDNMLGALAELLPTKREVL